MRISIEDSRTGKIIKLDVKENHVIEQIINVFIKELGMISSEQRSYALVLNQQELPGKPGRGYPCRNRAIYKKH